MGARGWPLVQGREEPIDEVDRQIVHALEMNPLAGFRELGDASGLNPRSVQRRLGSLVADGIVHVIASTHPQAEEGGTWMLRVSTTAADIDSLATSLVEVHGTRWIRSTRDGQELIVGLITPQHSSSWMVDDLAHDPRVRGVVTSELLTIWSQAALTTVRAPSRALDSVDHRLIDLLRADGRADTTELATQLGVDPSTVLRRRMRLLSERVITMLVETDREALGEVVGATIWVKMAPGAIRELGARLQSLPMCRFCAATSGTWALVLEVSALDNAALLEFVDRELSDPRITGVEIVPTAHIYKRSEVTQAARVREDGEVAVVSRSRH